MRSDPLLEDTIRPSHPLGILVLAAAAVRGTRASTPPSCTRAFEKRWTPKLSMDRDEFVADVVKSAREVGPAQAGRDGVDPSLQPGPRRVTASGTDTDIKLGIRRNLPQFTLLVIVNAFVGAMVGLERTILPAIAEHEFHLAARAAVLSFIVVFGVVKGATNYFAGRLSDVAGRKRILVAGWLAALPVPFLLMWAPSWTWILMANAFLGVSQGLTWSTTVIVKIDLAGPERRGLAMGLNEFAGCAAVGLSSRLLGAGTAMVYPTLLAAIGDVAHPDWRASAVGVYRLWRDLGYAAGALLSGATADLFGLRAAIWLVAALTFASGTVVVVRMRETIHGSTRRSA
jgi:MFS family permease